ncbi:hypothetical protein ACI3KS_19205 [Microbacterium sp. ZW T5_45]|uniref:hypothetical protein n=1 Tax=Microbacterium sp. ZW T5_45 TaxID=3378080 RepID=UPI00385309A4
MSDQNQNPTPENAPERPTPPAPPAADAPTVPVEPATAHDAAAAVPAESQADAQKPGRKRALLIGGGIAAALLLAGGGVAVGAAIGDEFGDDDDRAVASDGQRSDDDQDDRDDRSEDDAAPQNQNGQNQNGPVTGIGTDSADELVAIADAARGAADGVVTSIDAKRDGTWEVQLENSTGGETEVRVDADLVATVVSTDEDDDDSAPALTLDEATIRALVDAAVAEADGMITDLDVDDDASSPYDVSVLTGDRRSIDIDLSADFAVVGTDTDD